MDGTWGTGNGPWTAGSGVVLPLDLPSLVAGGVAEASFLLLRLKRKRSMAEEIWKRRGNLK